MKKHSVWVHTQILSGVKKFWSLHPFSDKANVNRELIWAQLMCDGKLFSSLCTQHYTEFHKYTCIYKGNLMLTEWHFLIAQRGSVFFNKLAWRVAKMFNICQCETTGHFLTRPQDILPVMSVVTTPCIFYEWIVIDWFTAPTMIFLTRCRVNFLPYLWQQDQESKNMMLF